MNPTTFAEIGQIPGLLPLNDEDLAAASPEDCPQRGPVHTSKLGIRSATCGLLSAECGRSVGVEEAVCRACRCHGPAALADNPYLVKQVVQVAYSSTVAGIDATEAKAPSDAELAVAVANVKTHCGDDVARRFVDTLVYNQSVAPEKAVALLEAHAIAEAGP